MPSFSPDSVTAALPESRPWPRFKPVTPLHSSDASPPAHSTILAQITADLAVGSDLGDLLQEFSRPDHCACERASRRGSRVVAAGRPPRTGGLDRLARQRARSRAAGRQPLRVLRPGGRRAARDLGLGPEPVRFAQLRGIFRRRLPPRDGRAAVAPQPAAGCLQPVLRRRQPAGRRDRRAAALGRRPARARAGQPAAGSREPPCDGDARAAGDGRGNPRCGRAEPDLRRHAPAFAARCHRGAGPGPRLEIPRRGARNPGRSPQQPAPDRDPVPHPDGSARPGPGAGRAVGALFRSHRHRPEIGQRDAGPAAVRRGRAGYLPHRARGTRQYRKARARAAGLAQCRAHPGGRRGAHRR